MVSAKTFTAYHFVYEVANFSSAKKKKKKRKKENSLDFCSVAPRARSPIAKKIWETHECEKFSFGYDVTFVLLYTVRPSVRNPTMLMRPC